MPNIPRVGVFSGAGKWKKREKYFRLKTKSLI